MPNVFGRRNRSVHFALTLIMTAFILGVFFYHPEPDRGAENFHTEGITIKHHWTTPTPIVNPVKVLQPTPGPTRVKHPHSIEHVGYLNKTAPPTDRTCPRPYKLDENETVNDVTRTQNVATLELFAENELTFPHQGPLAQGTILCLPQTCLLAHIEDDQKCRGLVDQASVQPEILAWNPSAANALESGSLCHALDVFGGVSICMSEPGKQLG